MKILYIDQYFSTREGNSGTRSYEFAKRFVGEGHKVTMLTTASRYSDLQGQRRWFCRQSIDGIEVVSLRIDYGQKMGYARRVFSFIAFMAASVAIGALGPRHDLVFASSTPLSVGVSGAVVAWFRALPFVFEVRDLWPQAPVELGIIKNPAIIAALRAVEKWIYRRADRINALSPGMVDAIAACGIDRDGISMIPNASDPDLPPKKSARQKVRRLYGIGARDFLVVYTGAIGPANDLTALVAVAQKMRESGAGKVRFLIVGEGSDEKRVRQVVKDSELSNVIFTGAVSRREVGEILSAADLGATCFAPLPVLRTCSPNKMFDYFSAGLPQMVNTPGWIADLVTQSGAGFYWPTDDPGEGAEKIIELSEDTTARRKMKAAAKNIAKKQFDRGILAAKLLKVFNEARFDAIGRRTIFRDLFDRSAALFAIVAASPFLIGIALAVKLEDGGPVFYKSERIGRNGEAFPMLKFRTMVAGAEKIGLGLNVACNDSRITRTGCFLREWSLDEAPQLFNVLFGNMNIVGPRPALREHVEQYSEKQKRRLRVRPGLTGWAQVNGRNALSWEKKLEYDAWYADNQSFALDMKIIAKTFSVVLRREGLYETDAGLNDKFNRFD